MSTYPAGTVAVATVRGVPNVRVMLLGASDYPEKWASGTPVHGARLHEDRHVTDVRHLVVLDLSVLSGTATAADLVRDLRDCNWRSIADQIEAQTKPLRIPEPMGTGAVVRATLPETVGGPSTLVRGNYPMRSWHAGDFRFDWHQLIDPVLIRDGIEDGAS